MARGFGATVGQTNSDNIATNLTSQSTVRSYAMWFNRNGDGGNGFGRILAKNVTNEDIFNNASAQLRYQRIWSGGQGAWQTTSAVITNGTWQHLVLTYDSSSASNDPIFYVNGVSVSVTETSAPSGSPTADATVFVIGNRPDATRGFDGMLAEIAIWDRILSAGEAAALAKGVSPMVFAPSLQMYVPCIRNVNDLKNNSALTVTGTLVHPHPRVFYSAIARSGIGLGVQTLLRNAAGAVTPAGALRKTLSKSYAGVVEYTRSLFKRPLLPKAGSISSAALLIPSFVRASLVFTGTITPTGVAIVTQVLLILRESAIVATGSLSKRVSKVLSAEITPGNSLLSYLIYPWYLVGQIAYRVGRRKA